MDTTRYKRPALGVSVALGTLYDIRTDSFLEQSIWNKEKPPESVVNVNVPPEPQSMEFHPIPSDNFWDKFKGLKISRHLQLSLLSGIYKESNSKGSPTLDYLFEHKNVRKTCVCSMTTFDEEIDFFANKIKKSIIPDDELHPAATHALIGVQWGAQQVISFESSNHNNLVSKDEFVVQCDQIKKCVNRGEPLNTINTNNCSLEVWSDGGLPGASVPSIEEVVNYLKMVPSKIEHVNGGRGFPWFYTLLPIPHMLNLIGIDHTRPALSLTEMDSYDIVTLFDDLRQTRRILSEEVKGQIDPYSMYLTKQDGSKIEEFESELVNIEMDLKTKLNGLLVSVRNGGKKGDGLTGIYNQFQTQLTTLKKRLQVMVDDVKEKIFLIKTLVSDGAQPIGINDKYEDMIHFKQKTYVLHFDDKSRIDEKELWGNNLTHFRTLLQKNGLKEDEKDKCHFYFVNENVVQNANANASVRIKCYRSGKTLSEDVLESLERASNDPFVGTYELREDGGFKEKFLKVGLDLGGQSLKWFGWYSALSSSPTVIITESEGQYSIMGEHAPLTFELDQEFMEQTPDGYEVQSIVKREGDKLIHTQTLTMNGRKGQRSTVREFSKKEMRVIKTVNGISARSTYSRANI